MTVDPEQHTFRYTIEFYLLKHLSHYVQPGAQLLRLPAEADALAFRNPDGRIVLVACNPEAEPMDLAVKSGGRTCALSLQPHSFNTLVF